MSEYKRRSWALKRRLDQSPDSVKDEFHRKGYSDESLKMLASEEGQLNAVYSCYGSAASEGQFLEDAVRSLLSRVSSGGLPRKREGLKKLIDELRKRITLTDERVWDSFHEAREVRNELIHHYFRNQEHKLKTEEGRMVMLMELVRIEAPIRKAKELICGIRVAVDQALEDGETLDEEIVISLSTEVEKSHLPPYT